MPSTTSSPPSTPAQRGAIDIRGIRKNYGAAAVLRTLSLQIRAGELFTLLGPSGSGKTTILNIIAGFTNADGGEVRIDGRRIDNIPIHRRDLGMVFQSYSLFPHMTVEQNVRFPLELRRVPAPQIRERVARTLELVEMDRYPGKYPSQLSGGQKQRVAIARALVFEPRVLLLDEPLSALDRKLRYQLQLELRRIQRILHTTMVFVTHDQNEAFTMSDRIAILHGGRIVQIGKPEELYEHPTELFAAQFLGVNSGSAGAVSAPGAATVKLPSGAEVAARIIGAGTRGRVQINIKAERARIATGGEHGAHGLPGVIRDVIFAGAQRRYVVDCALSHALLVSVPNTRHQRVYERQQPVWISWDAADLLAFPDEKEAISAS